MNKVKGDLKKSLLCTLLKSKKILNKLSLSSTSKINFSNLYLPLQLQLELHPLELHESLKISAISKFNIKKFASTTLIFSTIFSSCVYSTQAFSEDFRGKPSNPYISYHYVNKPISNVTYVNTSGTPVYGFDPDKGIVVDYFDQTMANPLTAVQSSASELGFDPNSLNMSSIRQNSKSIKDRLANLNVKGCWESAGATYHLDPWLLFAYAKTESSYNATAMNRNSNGSYDIGLMQINSSWLPTLRRYGIGAQDLLNPCRSIFVGAWIAAQNIQRFGYNIDGIGAYNSPGNLVIRRRYASKVYENYQYLVKEFYYKPRGQ